MKKIFYFLVFLSPSLFSQSLESDIYFRTKLCNAAMMITQNKVTYDPTYYKIEYPNGDVPSNKGVCTDVVIRSYRILGIDLQKEVHEDMQKNFSQYPTIWGRKCTDKNIDHRRVPNLMKFFERKGTILPISQNATDFKPGEIVCWLLSPGVTHIGIVINKLNNSQNRYLMVHNIGDGQVIEDCLFEYKIIGHYKYFK